MPTGNTAVYDCRIFQVGHKPGADVVLVQMFLQPGETAAGTFRENLIPQAPQSKHLHATVGQFANRIINLHLHIPGMRSVDISLHLLRPQERIVDKRIDAVCMMYINHISTHLFNLLYKIITMIITFAPLLIGIDRTERGDGDIKIIIQSVPLLYHPLPGIGIDPCAVGSLVDIDAAVSVIAPGNGHMQRLLVIEIRIQRTFICIVVETDLEAGIDIAYPGAILVFLHVPFPAEVFRAITAFLSQPHHITSYAGCQMRTQSYIFHGSIFAGNERHFIFDIPIRFHLPFQVHQETAVLVQSLPGDSSLFVLRDLKVQILPGTAIRCQFHRSR